MSRERCSYSIPPCVVIWPSLTFLLDLSFLPSLVSLLSFRPSFLQNMQSDFVFKSAARRCSKVQKWVENTKIWKNGRANNTLQNKNSIHGITSTGLYRSSAALANFSGTFDLILFEAVNLEFIVEKVQFGLVWIDGLDKCTKQMFFCFVWLSLVWFVRLSLDWFGLFIPQTNKQIK